MFIFYEWSQLHQPNYVCMYHKILYIHIYMHIHIHTYVQIYVYIYIFMCMYTRDIRIYVINVYMLPIKGKTSHYTMNECIIYTFLHTYMNIHVNTHAHIYPYECVYVYMSNHIFMGEYIIIYTCIYIYMYIHLYIYIYIYMYIRDIRIYVCKRIHITNKRQNLTPHDVWMYYLHILAYIYEHTCTHTSTHIFIWMRICLNIYMSQ